MTSQDNLRRSIRWAKDIVKLREPSIRNLALDWGLVEGRWDYTQFIILGRSRTGSNLLRGLLAAHSGVTVFGEIFKNPKAIEWGMDGHPESKRALALYQTAPVKFLETEVFRKWPIQTQAVGFKIFYYHAQAEPWKSVWSHLKNRGDLKVIHIKRKNILRTHLSRAKAERNSQWVNTSGDREKAAPIQLSYEACAKDFAQTRQWEAEYDAWFQDHSKIEILYEELAGNYAGVMKRVEGFLGLKAETVAPQTHKQSQEPLSQAIANYAELKQQFQQTPWAEFFDE